MILGLAILIVIGLSITGGYFLLNKNKEKSNEKKDTATALISPTQEPTNTPTPPLPTCEPSRPQGILFRPDGPTPTVITQIPTQAPCSPFRESTNDPAFTPDGKLTNDARRMLTVSALQLSLEKYYAVHKRFPQVLDSLFPDFAIEDEKGNLLSQPPTDPVSGKRYTYAASQDLLNYSLSATLDNGEVFTVTNKGISSYPSQQEQDITW